METFIPSDHLRRIHGGALYMDVADRKVWLQHVTASLSNAHAYVISTELHTLSERIAVFRAEVTITDEQGVILRKATGWGSETPQDFGDYIEKAETKALGRALSNAGFGTANAEPEGIIVDAPRGGDGSFIPKNINAAPGQAASSPMMNPNGSPTQKQVDFYVRLCVEKRYDPTTFAMTEGGIHLPEATKGQLSGLIDAIKAAEPNTAAAESQGTIDPGF